MGIKIYKKENRDRWEYGPYSLMDFRLDLEKDRWLVQYMLEHCSETQRRRWLTKYGLDRVPEPPVNVDDPQDGLYAPYLLLREQVMREDDYWTLKEAAFEAPDDRMRRFAFCRLTGYSWPPSECDAYSYRTYGCGLKGEVSREDIEDLCREMFERKGPFAAEAAGWLKALPAIGDDELAEWASGRTERRWDNEPDAVLRRLMKPAKDIPERQDLEDKICGIFDAYIFREFEVITGGDSDNVRHEAVKDPFTWNLIRWLWSSKERFRDVEAALSGILQGGGRQTAGLTAEQVSQIAWAVSPRSPQHSYFLWMAYWYPVGMDESDDDLALKLLEDAAGRGHIRSIRELVRIYASGKYVRRDFKRALGWQERKVGLLQKAWEEGPSNDLALREYAGALRETGDLLMQAGYAKRAKQYHRRAEQLIEKQG